MYCQLTCPSCSKKISKYLAPIQDLINYQIEFQGWCEHCRKPYTAHFAVHLDKQPLVEVTNVQSFESLDIPAMPKSITVRPRKRK